MDGRGWFECGHENALSVMQAYRERQQQKAAKALDRKKLEPRIHDYVRDTARSTLEKRSHL